jgi:hypothetical protein
MSSKVYFTRVANREPDEALAEKAAKLYAKAGFAAQLASGRPVAIKQHFGEKGTEGYLKPPIARRFAELIRKAGGKPFVTDTNTLYRGERSNAVDHLNLCASHGFTHEGVGCPVIIADGLMGSSQVWVTIDGKHYQRVPIAADAFHAHAIVVLTHVKGHLAAGLGGAIKNVGMGCASRAGKLDQHHGDVPIVDAETCSACARCAELCPGEAITVGKTAVIDKEKCIGCGECLAICPVGAVEFEWGETSRNLQEKMVEHALAVQRTHEHRMCYFNFMTHMTKECDCMGIQQEVLFEDVGIVAGDDIVAVEQATVDLILKKVGKDVFREFHPGIDYTPQLEYGEAVGLGSRKYELVEIA